MTVLKASNDPFQDVISYGTSHPNQLFSVYTDILTLYQALPHFSHISSLPVVIHVDATANFDYLTALRHSKLTFLQTFGAEDAQDVALVSYLYAARNSSAVVNFFASTETSESGSVIPTADIQSAVVDVTQSSQGTEGESEVSNFSLQDAFTYVSSKLHRPAYSPIELFGTQGGNHVVIAFATDLQSLAAHANVTVIGFRQYPVQDGELLAKSIPSTAKYVAVLEQLRTQTTAWTPLVQDIVSVLPASELSIASKLISFRIPSTPASSVFAEINSALKSSTVSKTNILAASDSTTQAEAGDAVVESAQKLESAYVNVLQQIFKDRLDILNATEKEVTGNESTPEFGYGKYLAQQKQKIALLPEVQHAIKSGEFTSTTKQDVVKRLSEWALATQKTGRYPPADSEELINLLATDATKTSQGLLVKKNLLQSKSSWLIGSDAWAYDLGNSGVHNVIASGKNLNMLVIDSQPYSEVVAKPGHLRKKDIGLYAMNFGNVYVASVAVYSSYTQLLQALHEAEEFEGPSVVVAYLPYRSELDNALVVLQETKKAVETGYWPLYRYNPLLDGENAFRLDSFQIRTHLQQFLERENKLTLLSKRSPTFARSLASSYGSDVREEKKSRAKSAFQKLLEGLSGPPITILFASDGGTAEAVAKRLGNRAKGRGLKAIVMAFDDYPFEELGNDENMVFISSTAGQGEFPQNGRALWEHLKSTNVDLAATKVAVFGLGDSLYWPRKEDKIYYNKPANDISARLSILGATELVPLGLGDEQADDGYSTSYNGWEEHLWVALGVDGVAGADEPPPITNEDIKIGSNYLRGTIAAGLKDQSTGAISATDQQLTKFHGIYMQDDRDIRDERKSEGLEPAYSFMVRVRLPGCVAKPQQWLKIDQLSDSRGNGTFKITTRGTFQLHGVIKENLKPAIRGMNSVLMDTVAACGDVDRNVVGAAIPENSRVHQQVVEFSNLISEHLLPETTAYHEIWLEGNDDGDEPDYTKTFEGRAAGPKKRKTMISGSTLVDHEPLYGPTYLPRKFKINIAVPPYNDVDVYGHDIGLIAILNEERTDIVGFNVLVGGGMGTTHNNRKTYPRTGSLMGYVPTDKIVDVCEKIMLVQRDFGDRKNRKHARVKYTIDDMGHDEYKRRTEERLGYTFEEPRPFHFDSNTDTFGWVTDETGLHHFTTFVENGRVEDTPELQFKTGLREIAHVLDKHNGEFRLTANQHVLVSNVTDAALPLVKDLLVKYKLDKVNFSGLRLSSAACVAFPTCGLAMAESERYLPELITKLEGALEEYGLRHDSIVMRMTGCPNGCARPWLAEVALVGKAYGAYNLMLGGGHHGERLNKLYKSSLKEDEILAVLKPLFKQWSLERADGEHFGDFLVRTKVIAATTEGKNFWEHVPEDA